MQTRMSSYPRRSLFHKMMGMLAMVLIIISLSLVGLKKCTVVVVSEEEAKQMVSRDVVTGYVARYFYALHVLHGIALVVSCCVLLLSCINLVPDHDDDIKFAFHFVTIFIIFCCGLSTLYASFVSFQKPCHESGECCSVRSTPGLLSSSESPALTSISEQDTSMMLVMTTDLVASLVLFVIAFVYFRDVRQEAEACGYLYRVHNEGYIVR